MQDGLDLRTKLEREVIAESGIHDLRLTTHPYFPNKPGKQKVKLSDYY